MYNNGCLSTGQMTHFVSFFPPFFFLWKVTGWRSSSWMYQQKLNTKRLKSLQPPLELSHFLKPVSQFIILNFCEINWRDSVLETILVFSYWDLFLLSWHSNKSE